MEQQPSDTPPEIERLVIEGYRRMSTGERAQRVWELSEFARGLALADIRRHHPDADERECLLRLASRYLDPDLLKRATGWDPREKGY